MKPLLWWENWGGISLHCFHGEKEKWRHVHSTSFQASLHITFPPGKQCSDLSPNFPHQNKGFINYVFCRNWAVRNLAGTRLDSSLVTKQVGQMPASRPNFSDNCTRIKGELCLVLAHTSVLGTHPPRMETLPRLIAMNHFSNPVLRILQTILLLSKTGQKQALF